MAKSKVYKFDVNNVAINPDVYTQSLKLTEKGRGYCLDLKLFVAKNNTGYVAGFSLKNMSTEYNSLPTKSVPCHYYSIAFPSKNKAIMHVLIDLVRHASLESFPVRMIVMIGNLFVHYCKAELSCVEK